MKVYAMSDIHGYIQEFEEALALVDMTGDFRLVLLGDYIHGPDSYAVMDKIIGLQKTYGPHRVIVLMGNHEAKVCSGEWNISDQRFGVPYEGEALRDEEPYLQWMSTLPLYHIVENALFVHAGIDEEWAAMGTDMWEWGVDEEICTAKFPPQTGEIEGFSYKIVAGHVGTHILAQNPDYYGIYYDGGSHYYIDGTVQQSGEIPVLMYDTQTDIYYRVTQGGVWPICPYEEM